MGSKMGWIQQIIGQAAPLVASVLSSAWSVISPILDMAISVFQLLFNVTQTVFNGILGVVQNVWNAIQPIISSVADALSWVSSKVSGLFGGIFGGGGGGSVGANADGTNNWRGGPTWVGEKGPELVDLPRGSRVLPNKESVQVARAAAQPQRGGTVIHLTIAKLADQIIVREDADIDRIGEAVAKKVILAIENLVPA